MDSFIDQLSSTLQLDNLNYKCDEDIKDEIFEDLEEEAIQAESMNENKSNVSRNKKSSPPPKANRPARTAFFNGNLSNEDEENEENLDEEEDDDCHDDISNMTIANKKNNKLKPTSKDLADLNSINNLGATNHMHNRINQLERFEASNFLI